MGTGGIFSASSIAAFSELLNRFQRRAAMVAVALPDVLGRTGSAGTDSWEILRERREARDNVDGLRLPAVDVVGVVAFVISSVEKIES